MQVHSSATIAVLSILIGSGDSLELEITDCDFQYSFNTCP